MFHKSCDAEKRQLSPRRIFFPIDAFNLCNIQANSDLLRLCQIAAAGKQHYAMFSAPSRGQKKCLQSLVTLPQAQLLESQGLYSPKSLQTVASRLRHLILVRITLFCQLTNVIGGLNLPPATTDISEVHFQLFSQRLIGVLIHYGH
ncbi:hypothetical protein RvY_03746 [Ramazzottius varieornatus]|uniref:Uncharacterized protein n=1 Tax=Ramazzottius varieornatus TaxID=947166 RepID=A0A1D1UW99_RAMVA|nr:hypothetical protein RvY_03746 [Ramazzottius varieornatus]